jgi:hypothetical protein
VTAHSRRRSRSHLPPALLRVGRLLLIINVVVLILSSFTEHFWTWDRFLRGGQDFELSLLALLAFFCLILVLAAQFRRSVRDRFAHDGGHPVTRENRAPALPAPPLVFILSSQHPPGPPFAAALSSVVLRI